MSERWEDLNKLHLFIALALLLGFFLALPSLREELESTGASVITRQFPIVDGPFTAYSNYVVKDSRTGLEWYCRHDARAQGINAVVAREWVKNLSVDGGGWRLPSLQELYGLYKAGSYNQGSNFGLENDWTGNRSPLLWVLEADHSCLNSWIWSGDTYVESEGVFVGTGITKEIRTAKDGEEILYFDFDRGWGEGTGPNPIAEDINYMLGQLSSKTVYAGVCAVR